MFVMHPVMNARHFASQPNACCMKLGMQWNRLINLSFDGGNTYFIVTNVRRERIFMVRIAVPAHVRQMRFGSICGCFVVVDGLNWFCIVAFECIRSSTHCIALLAMASDKCHFIPVCYFHSKRDPPPSWNISSRIMCSNRQRLIENLPSSLKGVKKSHIVCLQQSASAKCLNQFNFHKRKLIQLRFCLCAHPLADKRTEKKKIMRFLR